MTMLMTLGILVAIVALFVGLERALTPETTKLDERLLRYGARRFVVVDETFGETRQQSQAAATVTGAVGKAIQGRSFAHNMQADLARADVKLTAAEFLTIQGIMAFIVGILFFALASLFSPGNVVALALGALIGYFLPRFWLRRRENGRIKAFNDQLADTITLMGNSLRSGMSLLQSMEMISHESAPPIGPEFGRVVREIGLGVAPQDALQHLVRRIRSDDLDLMVTAILVQHEVGGNLSRILDTIAHTIRERVKIKGEIRAITGQQRMAGYMLAGLPVVVALILSVLAPKYIGSFINPMGPWTALPICAAVSIILGFIIIQKIVAIEV